MTSTDHTQAHVGLTPPFDMDEMISFARIGVEKINQWGQRGATNCSINEIVGMAFVLQHSDLLEPLGVNETPIFKTVRRTDT